MTHLGFAQRCVSGDKLAWDEFVDKYSRLIYKYIHSVLGSTGAGSSFSQDDISDLFQEIFLSLVEDNFRKLKSFKGKNRCSLASWLRQVAVNHTIDYIRKHKTLISLDAETNGEESSLMETIADLAPDSADNLIAQERIVELKDCIDKLETEDKYFLELHINQGLSPHELEGIFGISRGAIDMRKSRIINRLKECFKSKGFVVP
jgi:RNA polymerase sigma factor (sigma-70 family)